MLCAGAMRMLLPSDFGSFLRCSVLLSALGLPSGFSTSQFRSISFNFDLIICRLLGPSAFAGVGVILFAYVINVPLIKWNLYVSNVQNNVANMAHA